MKGRKQTLEKKGRIYKGQKTIQEKKGNHI